MFFKAVRTQGVTNSGNLSSFYWRIFSLLRDLK